MSGFRFYSRKIVSFIICVFLCLQPVFTAFAHDSSTLFNGCRSDEVKELQQALIKLGFLKGNADGIFGNNTENAVRRFQKKNKLTVDGLAGAKTRELIMSKAQDKKETSDPVPSPDSVVSIESDSSSDTGSASLFSSYSSIRYGSKGDRVSSLQQALISLGYLTGSADGVFGNRTRTAVRSFQRSNHLKADGVAGKKTLQAIQTALAGGTSPARNPDADPASPSPDSDKEALNPKISAPDLSSVQPLHWFNTVKPSLSGNQRLLIYDPDSDLSWTLRILARGRHCDAEPLSAQDTRTMVAAFGGVNTWNQKAVFVRLPDGRWSLASTHDMPHDSGTIKDNNFNGHLCVHFLRDMDEAARNDPNYGVANQSTIRSYWKKMTGEDIP